MTKLLLFFWFPFSIGIVTGLSKTVALGMLMQHFILLLFPIYAIVRGLITGRIFHCLLAFFGFGLVFIHAMVFNFQLSVVIKLLGMLGVVQWAYLVSRELSFEEFISTITKSAIAFFILSILFIVLFPSLAKQYFFGEYVLTSFYAQKNTYGRFVCLAIIFTFFNYLLTKNKTMLLVMAVMLVALIGTSSRTSIGIALIGVLVVITVRAKLMNVYWLQLGLAAVVALMLYGIISGNIYFYGLGSALDGVSFFGKEIWTTGRATAWNSIFYQITYDEKWLLGYGLDRFFSDPVTRYRAFGDIGLGRFIPSDPHNGYVDLVLSYGLLGFGLWTCLVLYIINCSGARQLESIKKAFLIVIITIYLASNISESFIVKTTNFYCFLFFYAFFMVSGVPKKKLLYLTKGFVM